MKCRLAALAALGVLTASLAFAQSSRSPNVSGTVAGIDASSIQIEHEGGKSSFPLAQELVVLRIRPATIADIRSNDFIASAAEPKEDGTLHSTELRIFPERLRGVGEGQRPMNDARKQVMTNATVTGPAAALGGDRVRVSFPGGEAVLVVGKDVPVTRIEEAQRSDIQPGQRVRLQGSGDGPVNRVTIQ